MVEVGRSLKHFVERGILLQSRRKCFQIGCMPCIQLQYGRFAGVKNCEIIQANHCSCRKFDTSDLRKPHGKFIFSSERGHRQFENLKVQALGNRALSAASTRCHPSYLKNSSMLHIHRSRKCCRLIYLTQITSGPSCPG